MPKKSTGPRRKTRKKFRKKARERGKLNINLALQEFKVGEKVAIDVEPSFHKGMPFKRFIGKVGKVIGKRGRCYEVEVSEGSKRKVIVVHPIHLRRC
ncbi:50S ribosomal protein L21e [Nanoarchaeota archaeon]|nr:MAG: 50S ribosomal protein L21e [Nanoarchaeota archaeon]